MAQNFRRYIARNVGTSAVTLHTANSYDTVIGIALANTTSSEIKVDVDFGIVAGIKFNKHIGLFGEGRYLKYFGIDSYSIKAGLNYTFF